MAEMDALQESSGMPLDVLDEQLRRMGVNPELFRRLPAVSLQGPQAQPPSQVTSAPTRAQVTASGTPPVSLTGGAPRPDLPAPIERLKETPQNLFRTPVVSLTGQPNVQQPSRYDGVVPLSPADRGWLESAKLHERSQREQESERGAGTQDVAARSAGGAPTVRLSDPANASTQVSAPQSGDTAGNAMSMFAASRANGGASAPGAPAVQPRTAEDDYRDLLKEEPTRAQFPRAEITDVEKGAGAGRLQGHRGRMPDR